MNLILYSCLALPLWCAFFALYFILRREKLMRQSLIAKCAGSFLSVGSAGLALYLAGERPLLQPMFWFFVLCTIADALLEIRFEVGMLAFGAAHVCWIAGLAGSGFQIDWRWSLPVWLTAMLAALILFRRELPKMGILAVFCTLYVGVLAASLALMLPLPLLYRTAKSLPFALGMLCFFVSDMMVAKSEFSRRSERLQKPVMLLYWAALYLLSAMLWGMTK